MLSKSRKFNSEDDVKAAIKALLKKYNIWYFMPSASIYGRAGIPDFVCCAGGRFLAIEAKFGYNKPRDLQETRMEEIRAANGIAVWVNENRLEQLEALLFRMMRSAS